MGPISVGRKGLAGMMRTVPVVLEEKRKAPYKSPGQFALGFLAPIH